MRALMLGWDFSPRLSGGVGSACQGLANALARGGASERTDVLFVLPRVRGDEEAEHVRLFSGRDVERDVERHVERNGATASATSAHASAPRLAVAAPTRAAPTPRAAPDDPGAGDLRSSPRSSATASSP
jgi:hypothetical protein